MTKKPSLIKIITIDYLAFVAFLSPIVLWAFYIFLALSSNAKNSDSTLLIIFAIITVIGLGVLTWRVQAINAIFSDGIETPATISNVSFFRDRGRADYVYTFQGQKYVNGNALHKVKQTQALQIGEQVVLMVDRNNPKSAFIRDLYL